MKMVLALENIREKRLKQWFFAIFYSVVFIFLLFCLYSEKVNRDLSDSMIRLHIVANSDSDSDQALKYRVRNAVIAYMNEQMDKLEGKADARVYVNKHLHELEKVANNVIQAEGFQETARVSFGKFPFPTKQYENMALPAGYYDAVKIDIGKAEGQNWWCIMFPPLCFIDDTQGEMEEEYMNVLKEELTEDEMELILTSSEEDEIPVAIKFKIVEIFQDSKIKLASLFRGVIQLD